MKQGWFTEDAWTLIKEIMQNPQQLQALQEFINETIIHRIKKELSQ